MACKRGAGRGRRTPENLAEHRIAVNAEVEALPLFFRRRPVPLALPDRRDIIRIVEPGELLDGGNRAVDILRRRQPAQSAAQIDRQGNPRNRQRMLAAVTRPPINLAADK